jgi:quercetin dioxygenase-like cupin family protein
MITKRVAAGLLAGATLIMATACSSDNPRPTESLQVLHQQALPNVEGKTYTSAVLTLPPNALAKPHTHGQAYVYAYVLEGVVRSKLDDEPVTTYHKGEDWVELPGVHHVLTENASKKKPAKLLVEFVSNTGDPLKIVDPD